MTLKVCLINLSPPDAFLLKLYTLLRKNTCGCDGNGCPLSQGKLTERSMVPSRTRKGLSTLFSPHLVFYVYQFELHPLRNVV